MNKLDKIKKDFDDECDAAGRACAARLLRAVNTRNRAMQEATDALKERAQKKGAAPKDRPKLRKQPVQPSARKG